MLNFLPWHPYLRALHGLEIRWGHCRLALTQSGREKLCVIFIDRGESASLVLWSDNVHLCVTIKSWHARDHINEDLQLQWSGRVGPVAAKSWRPHPLEEMVSQFGFGKKMCESFLLCIYGDIYFEIKRQRTTILTYTSVKLDLFYNFPNYL